ncbi:microtubule-associated protein RP/EB family member 1 [Drosophila sulfurigaster albostrigata]|uniref:microtubule-associated protein RP/EB family member 1 n=1 Tax=Drosophila sulfurigaster albostrigata TaxID=89887 RepID=UPI002D21B121|nr:microtubule-associated protein RP/EB family member 1 [Drosophila sulfurigaster albostrigata]XP_062141044.1 microtubule-associated protein RP/EB family member 1 [Drosophila sulfurigaster albostrigata]
MRRNVSASAANSTATRNQRNRCQKAVNVSFTRNSRIMSRHDIMFWINHTLQSNIPKIEDLCTGAAYCQLMDILFPGTVRIRRVKFTCNQAFEYINNFRILLQSLNMVEATCPVDVQQLVKGRFQDNYEFAMWFRIFYEANFKQLPPDYNPHNIRDSIPLSIGPSRMLPPPVSTPRPKRRSLSVPQEKATTMPTKSTTMQVQKQSKEETPLLESPSSVHVMRRATFSVDTTGRLHPRLIRDDNGRFFTLPKIE